ncbi:DNA-directed RNA polymerase III subunit RPC4 [Triplophysa tibetana]|uniref:DNA-directed RNA polymerase III subunit RPC4 n=1 Tax=Triplophysa tibetana TaxID=1572043 RepID=A0A5A9PVN3_9TELE|nr:DNA-directed RNA polymerase III subunit RPC4 [Triplophysa tibetana]
MSDHGDGDPEPSFRSSFALGRGLPGRISLNPPPPGRLTSLRSRDLTLGGFKKKTFVPNVNSVRKTKDELQEETHTAPKKERRDDRQRERRRREKPQTIQSHSIFEQGPADTYRKPSNWGASNPSNCDPALVTKCFNKEKINIKDDDDAILQKLQRDDFLDDPGLKNDPTQRPIRLPLRQACNLLSTDAANTFKEEPDVLKPATSVSPQLPTVRDLFEQLCVSDREELLFIQLPDVIPGQPKNSSSPEKKRHEAVKPADKRLPHVQDQTEKTHMHVLSDFSEGLIGKLQIRRSGKVQLLMGNVTLDVSEGAAFSFLQHLVCVRLSEGRTGDMTVLGNVTHKLVCSPDFETLLQEVKPDSHTKS